MTKRRLVREDGRVVLTDGPEQRSVSVPVAKEIVLATAGTQVVTPERLRGLPEADVARLGRACLRPSRAALGFSAWSTPAGVACVKSLAGAARDRQGLFLAHSMRKCTDTAGGGRYSRDGLFAPFAGDWHGQRRLHDELAHGSKAYRYESFQESGPTEALLARSDAMSWGDFRRAYETEVETADLDPLVFALIAATARDLLPVILCAEAYVPCFDELSPAGRARFGCHRFLAARALVRRLSELGFTTTVIDLDATKVARELAS